MITRRNALKSLSLMAGSTLLPAAVSTAAEKKTRHFSVIA
jgi:hypothetical protein